MIIVEDPLSSPSTIDMDLHQISEETPEVDEEIPMSTAETNHESPLWSASHDSGNPEESNMIDPLVFPTDHMSSVEVTYDATESTPEPEDESLLWLKITRSAYPEPAETEEELKEKAERRRLWRWISVGMCAAAISGVIGIIVANTTGRSSSSDTANGNGLTLDETSFLCPPPTPIPSLLDDWAGQFNPDAGTSSPEFAPAVGGPVAVDIPAVSASPITPYPTSLPTTLSPTPAPTLVPPVMIPIGSPMAVSNPTGTPTVRPTSSPSQTPTTPAPTTQITPAPTTEPCTSPAEAAATTAAAAVAQSGGTYTTVLEPRQRMSRGESMTSPNGKFSFKMTNVGDLIVCEGTTLRWHVDGEGAATLNMQPDGNLLLRKSNRQVTWKSITSANDGATLQLDNGGQIAVVSVEGTSLWLAGIPKGTYSTPSAASLTFPIRAAFYYPWFPETWTVGGKPIHFEPTIGKYSNGDKTAQINHVKSLEYAHVDMAIASWWGPNSKNDRARITNLMDKSAELTNVMNQNRGVKWTVYHEQERQKQPSVEELKSDLAYLKKWFTWHESWAHIDGKPVIFVWNQGNCNVSERWMAAAEGEWHVVIKLFGKHDLCPVQPSDWHEYAPSKAVVHKPGYSYAISPGFWRAEAGNPVLPRLPIDEFRGMVTDMVASNEHWQLITTFNEWGEGTAVESAVEWASGSGYGQYLDVLNQVPPM